MYVVAVCFRLHCVEHAVYDDTRALFSPQQWACDPWPLSSPRRMLAFYEECRLCDISLVAENAGTPPLRTPPPLGNHSMETYMTVAIRQVIEQYPEIWCHEKRKRVCLLVVDGTRPTWLLM